MRCKKLAVLCLVSFGILGLLAAPAAADWIGSVSGYNDGTKLWEGVTHFSNAGPVLDGDIEWAVFAPGDFPFSGYTPTSGQFTYVYQIHNGSASSAVSSYGVILSNSDANNIAYFSDSTLGTSLVAPNSANFGSSKANWLFSTFGSDSSSYGLVFSSPRMPVDYYSIVVDGGTYAMGAPIPSPGANAIPEPATVWSLVSILCAGLAMYWRRKNR